MKLYTRWIAALLCLAMIVSFAGCKSTPAAPAATVTEAPAAKPETKTDAAAKTAEATAPTATPAPTPIPVPAGRTEILCWSSISGSVGKVVDADIAAFNESQSKYWITSQYQGGFMDTFAKMQATDKKNLPDMCFTSTELCGTFLLSGMVVPLSNYISKNDTLWTSLNGNCKACWGDSDGDPIGYPFGNSFSGTFVNMDIFNKAGIDPYEALTSTKGLYETSKKLVDGGYCKYGIGLDSSSIFVWYALATCGLQVLNNNNGRDGIPTKVMLDDPEVKAALHDFYYYLRLAQQEGYILPLGSSWGDECLPTFAKRDVAGITGTIAGYTRIFNATKDDPIEVGYVPMWTGSESGDRAGYPSSGTGTLIIDSGDAAAQAGVVEFMKFLSKPEQQNRLTISIGYLPTTQEAFDSADYQDYVATTFPHAAKAFAIQQAGVVDTLHSNPVNPINNDFQTIAMEIWERLMADYTLDIDTLIDEMQSRLQESLDLWVLANS